MAVDRADDIGTQFPVDADDSAPLDPQLGRQEYDYSTGPEPRALGAGAAAAAAEPQIAQYILISVADDTYIVKPLADAVEGSLEQIAKPWQLRRTVFDGEEVSGISFEYETSTLRKVTDALGAEFFEEVVPRYYTLAEIMYASEVANTEVTGISKIELNTGAHHWTRLEGIFRARIVTIFDDYLSCLPVDDDNDNVVGADEFFVAKPTKLQKILWDGKTISGGSQDISYVYTGIDLREATLVGGDDDGDMQEEVIVPRYSTTTDALGDIIHYTQVANGTGVFAADPDTGDPVRVIFIDLNIDSRAWVRSKVIT